MAKSSGNRSLAVAIVAALVVVGGLCVWWMMREDATADPPKPPVVQTQNPGEQKKKPGPEATGTPAEPTVAADPEGSAPAETAATEESVAPEEELQTIDSEAAEDARLPMPPAALLTFRTAPPLTVAPSLAVYDSASLSRGIGRAVDTADRRLSRGGKGPLPMPTWQPTLLANGSWSVPGIMPEHEMLWVFAPGFLPSSAKLEIVAGRDFDAGTLVLEPGAAISGVVTDEDGRPLAGAAVGANHTTFQILLQNRVAGAFAFTTTSGADGSYRISGLEALAYQVTVSLDGYHDGMAATEAKELQPAKLDFKLARADAVVHGRIDWGPQEPPRQTASKPVFAITAGSALAKRISKDAPLPAVMQQEAEWAELAVSSDWTFRRALKAGRYKFVYAHGSEFGLVEADAASGEETEVVFTMGAASGITGIVTWTDGSPLVGAEVIAFGPKPPQGRISLDQPHTAKAKVTADSKGRYTIEALQPGEYLLWLPAYPQHQPHPWHTQRSPHSIVITSGVTGTLDISLTAAGDGASVFLDLTLDGKPVRLTHSTLALFKDARKLRHAGFFALPDHRMLANDVPRGTHAVSMTLSGLSITSSPVTELIEFTVPHGVTEVTVVKAWTTVEFSAHLKLPEGSSPVGLDVAVYVGRLHGVEGDSLPPISMGYSLRTDGTIRPRRVTPGRYRVEVRAKNHVTRFMEVDVLRDTHAEVELGEPTGTLVIEFAGLEGPHDQASLAKFQADESTFGFRAVDAGGIWAYTGNRDREIRPLFSRGQARIEGLFPGRLTVHITHGMAEPYSAQVDITSGAEIVLRATFRIAPHLTVTIPALDAPADEGREGVLVIVRPIDSEARAATFQLTKQPDGSYRGESYVRAIGDVVIQTTAGHATDETARINLPRDGRVEHTIRIKPKE